MALLNRIIIAAIAAGALAGCYSPKFEECSVLCGADDACPDGLQCRSGWCTAQPGEPACTIEDVPVGTVSVGTFHACHIDGQDRLHCWGSNRHGQVGAAEDVTATGIPQQLLANASVLDTGPRQTCAIAGGALYCWGDNIGLALGLGAGSGEPVFEPQRVGMADRWTAVGVSSAHGCGLQGDGQLYCWGSNDYGEVGVDDMDNHTEPVPVEGRTWSAISVGGRSTCGISQGELYCWGSNERGQFGIMLPDSDRAATPQRVGEDADWTSVSNGLLHTCGIRGNGELYCWGSNDARQIGVDGASGGPERLRVAGQMPWRAVSAGEGHTCAIDTGDELYCWGRNDDGRLGLGTITDHETTPRRVEGGPWARVEAGVSSTCAIRAGGDVHCWGDNARGQLGHGSVGDKLSPQQVGVDADWSSVAAGRDHTCAIKSNGSAYCWGLNRFGQLGDDTTASARVPVQVAAPSMGAVQWQDMTAGTDHTCAIDQQRDLYCWGSNQRGELGIGDSQTISLVPAYVVSAETWRMVSTGDRFTCGLDNQQSLQCWGENLTSRPQQLASGQWDAVAVGADPLCAIQGGEMYCSSVPDAPGSLTEDFGWTDVSAGEMHVCGIQGDQSLWCWGDNTSGQIGVGQDVELFERPEPVPDQNLWHQVEVGARHGCAIDASATLHCWGDNSSGAIGVDAFDSVITSPGVVAPVNAWAQVSAGGDHTCGVHLDGTLHCWGKSTHNQLGHGDGGTSTPGDPVAFD